MGVKDLMTWIKRVHPGAISEFPTRWAAPEIRGRRVAVDGTLITNRFHFALRKRMELRGKHALRGWLVSEMMAHGVRPVAIWDEKGERGWKAQEARRRLETRTLALARKLHEDRRALRLARMRRELLRFASLSAREQEVVRLWWRWRTAGAGAGAGSETGAGEGATGNPNGSNPTPPAAAHLSSLPSDPTFLSTAYALARLSSHLHRLSWLLKSYTFDADPALRCGSLPQTLFEAFQAEEEAVWRIVTDGHGDAFEEQEKLWADPSDEVNALLEARLRALEPASVYAETRRQRALTEGEGEVWALAFGSEGEGEQSEDECRPESPTSQTSRVDTKPHTPAEDDRSLRLAAALAQLDDLRATAPSVRNTYMSNLIVPLESEHAACRELLQQMGVPVLFAPVPYEAEGFASAMALRGQVDFVGTEDSDVVVYGAPLLRNLSTPTAPLVLVDCMAVRELAGWSESTFREFCILLGTDANPRIPGIGPMAAQEWVEQYTTIEDLLAAEPDVRARLKKLDPASDADVERPALQEEIDPYLETVRASRTLFDLLPPTPDVQFDEYTPARDVAVRAWLAENGVHVKAPGERSPRSENEKEEDEIAAELGFDVVAEVETEFGRENLEEEPDEAWDEVWDEERPKEMASWEAARGREETVRGPVP